MDHRASEPASMPIGHPAVEDASHSNGHIRAHCCIERSAATGRWYFYSDEWRGLLVTDASLTGLLAKIPAAGKALADAMRQRHAEKPYTDQKLLRQMKIYEDFFHDQPSNDSTIT